MTARTNFGEYVLNNEQTPAAFNTVGVCSLMRTQHENIRILMDFKVLQNAEFCLIQKIWVLFAY